MLNKIASNYLEKIAFWNTTKDIVRNIPKGIADFALNTTQDTLIPAGRFGHKLGARINAPFVAIPSLWNKQYDSTPLRNYGKAMCSYVKGVDNWVNNEYKDVNQNIVRDRQTIDRVLPTITKAGAFTRKLAEMGTATGVGLAIGGSTPIMQKAMSTASAFKTPIMRNFAKAGVFIADKFGTDEIAYGLTKAGDQILSKPENKRITPTGEYLLGLYGNDNYVPKYW